MKRFLTALAFAVLVLFTAAPASAQQAYGVRGEAAVGIMGPQPYYGNGYGSRRYSREDDEGEYRSAHRCMQGYEWYPEKRECIEMHSPRLVEKARCTPGETRRVPDPSRQGGFRILECLTGSQARRY